MEVKLIRITEEPEELIARCYAICQGRDTIPQENIQEWIRRGHLSPIESASASFLIEEISRSCLAQLTRHRLTSFSVESMRYVGMEENGYVTPDSIKNGLVEGGLSIPGAYRGMIEVLYHIYEDMIEQGIPKEDARMILPLATHTRLIMTANFRQLRHMIKLRTDKSAQWEIQELFNENFLDFCNYSAGSRQRSAVR